MHAGPGENVVAGVPGTTGSSPACWKRGRGGDAVQMRSCLFAPSRLDDAKSDKLTKLTLAAKARPHARHARNPGMQSICCECSGSPERCCL